MKMSAILKISFYDLLFLIFVSISKCEESIEVVLKQGVLSGRVEKTFMKNRDYYAFRGVPYAEPPIGTLRFQPPKPYEKWEGTYEAFNNKPTCLQLCSRTRNNEPFGISGSEDCLYLSIFTPGLEGNYPVVVFDYNDNFKTGFNGTDTYSPDFFIDEDVVVVTITHRLGLFGYLTTEDDIIPANNGLRDFIFGLNWVKQNIDKFGGDPKKVTLMGNKGGAALAHILLYAKQAKGLFSAIIMQSGTALEPNYFYENPRVKAFEMGEGFEIKTDDSKILLEELQKLDAEKLKSFEIMVHDSEGLKKNQIGVDIFTPTIEREHENAIITALPQNSEITVDVPVLIGLTSREGLDLVQHFLFNPKLLEQAMNGIAMHFPIRTGFRFDENSTIFNFNARTEINELYFKDGYLHLQNILEYAMLLGDTLHGYSIDKTAKMLTKHLESAVFYYMFDFRGLLNENSEYLARYSRFPLGHWGATVTDELCYLHVCSRMKKSYKELKRLVSEQNEFKLLKKMVKLWTNFAKTRNPTPAEDDTIKGIKWQPVDKASNEINYLHITKNLKMKKEPLGHRSQFWDEFLEKYSKMAVDGVVTDEEGAIPIINMRFEDKEETKTAEIEKESVTAEDKTVITPDDVTILDRPSGNREINGIVIVENSESSKNTVIDESIPDENTEPDILQLQETRDEL